MDQPSKARCVAGWAVVAVTVHVCRGLAQPALARAGCHQQWHKHVLVQEEPGSCLLLGGGLGRWETPSARPGGSPQSQARSLTSPAVPRGWTEWEQRLPGGLLPPVPSAGVAALPSILFSVRSILAPIDGRFPAGEGRCCPAGRAGREKWLFAEP